MQSSLIDSYISSLLDALSTPLPETSVLHAKRCLIDYLGATLAGAKMARGRHEALLRILDDNGGAASLIGLDRKSSLFCASLINGISSHTAELDDGVISGIIHPGAPLFSALLPYAQASGTRAEGDALIRSIVGGYEASVRLANAIQPSHKIRGWHATATCGSIGAVFAIMLLRGASHKLIKNALSIALVSASGSLKVLEDNSELKPFNAGYSAQSAITAIALAESGYTGPNDALSGKAGFLAMMADSFDQGKLLGRDSDVHLIENVYLKPYAACRYCHPAIESAIGILDQHNPDLVAIESIHVETYQLAVTHHDHTEVNNVSSAKMSIPYSTAVALVHGQAGADQFSAEAIRSPEVQRIMKKVTVAANSEFTAAFPGKTCAKVTVAMRDQSRLVRQVDEPLGDPGNPLSDVAVFEKFSSLADFAGMPKARANRILEACWNLPERPRNLFHDL